MKEQHEKIKRFKEGVILMSFLFLLFSFSNKSFGKSADLDKEAISQDHILKASALISGNTGSPALIKISVSEHPGNFYSKKDITYIQNKKIAFTSKLFIKKQQLLKLSDFPRLYYQLFSSQSEEYHPG